MYGSGAECPHILDLLGLAEHLHRCRFCSRQMEIAARRHSRESNPRNKKWIKLLVPVLQHSVTAAAASILLAVLCWSLARPTSPAVVTAVVVDWGLSVESLPGHKGPGLRIVYNGQGFHFQPRIVTKRTHGWLYQIDSRRAWMLKRLSPQPDGTLGCSYEDSFDDNEGVELFCLILADEHLPALEVPEGPAAWLSAEERGRLQELAKEGSGDGKVVQLLRAALERHGWRGTADDLRVQRLEHISQ